MTDTSRTSALPSGTVTFLFTDIEGSTKLLQEVGDAFGELLAAHAALMRETIASGGGAEVRTEGDAFFAAFDSANGAVTTAVEAQRALAGHAWPAGAEIRVRMGIHTGAGVLGGDDYVGLDVHRAARIASTGHGGQVVLSQSTAHLVEHSLPVGVLLRELGEYTLKDLAHPERIFQLIIPELQSDFPPLVTLDTVPNNLPRRLSTFVGRKRELVQAIELLEGTRLLTLTGPGGTGKTRLALQVGAEVSGRFRDGVFFVPLDPVDENEEIPPAILDALGVTTIPSGAQPLAFLCEHVARKELLMILDNLEHLLDSASLFAELMSCSVDSKALVTSRAPLRIAGEQEMPVPPLEAPDPRETPRPQELLGYEAVVLFSERARSVKPDFEVTSENAGAVAELTEKLDGLPLAIELVATRVKLLPPEGILKRLDSVLLTGGSRDLPARQQTLRDTIAWSYELLDEATRRLFERFSVFAGSAALDQIEAVCGPADELGCDVLEGLATLIDHSLVVRSDGGGEPRFSMLEVIREYAAEQLDERGETDELHGRHAGAYLELAERAAPQLTRKKRGEWLERLSFEYHNMDVALTWAVDSREAEIAHRLVGSLWRFWQIRGHLVAVDSKVDAALALETDVPEARAKALEARGGVTYWLGDVAGTLPYYREALEIWREVGDQSEIANGLFNLAFPAGQLEGPDAAESLLSEALAIYHELGDRSGIGRIYWGLGGTWMTRGDFAKWAELTETALEHFDQDSEPFDYGWALFQLAGAEYMQGELERAVRRLDDALKLFASVGDLSAIVLFIVMYTVVARGEEKVERYQRLAGALSKLVAETGWAPAHWDPLMAGMLDLSEIQRMEASPPEPFREGREMSVPEIVAYALDRESSETS